MQFTSELLNLAHSIRRTDSGETWGTCIKQAMKAITVKNALRSSLVTLRFYKADGTPTFRTATLLADYLPAPKPATNSTTKKRVSKSAKVTFWSVTDNGFRSFIPDRLIGWDVQPQPLQQAA